ncbi:YczE/YyaS/YitT family protein [Marisediminicola sp. LYQ85]|uniref:membrane protein YczE n=1 Tax=Marisediminicola sp. LYQ85 TaxID=3391062 RepID=UPI00398362EA
MPLLLVRRILQLLVGLFFYGFAIAMMVRAGIGASPWDVLSQGIALQTTLSFGLVTNLVGAAVLLLWIPIRQRPGIGTVANVLIIGPSAEVGLAVLPHPPELWMSALLFAGGLALLALATGLYLGARFGPGPRDGLMTGIHRRWGVPLWIVRTAIEGTVLAIGWALGGVVGVGTLAFALLIGPMVGRTIPWFAVPEIGGVGARGARARGARATGAGAGVALGADIRGAGVSVEDAPLAGESAPPTAETPAIR